MDLNLPHSQTEINSQIKELPTPIQNAKRQRRKRAWRSTRFLSQQLRAFEREANKLSAQKAFDLNLPPKDEITNPVEIKSKRVKIQKNTKGKRVLKFGLSTEKNYEQGAS